MDFKNRLSKRYWESVHRAKHEPQGGAASLLSNSASKTRDAEGEGVRLPETNTDGAGKGEALNVLPGSKSVAREEGDIRNLGGPETSRRTNYESQAGRQAQRQEAQTEEIQGVGSVHSSPPEGKAPQASEGIDKLTKTAQATGPVRMTEQSWQTFLQAIADKARMPCQLDLGFFQRIAYFVNGASIKLAHARVR